MPIINYSDRGQHKSVRFLHARTLDQAIDLFLRVYSSARYRFISAR